MRKDDLKKIRIAAEQLPRIYETRTISITGEEILSEQPKAVDKKGKPINPKWRYKVDKSFPVNHENRMKAIFKAAPKGKGHDHVYEYCQAVIDIAEKQNKELNKKLDSMSV